jgi:DNA-binding NarL/FixJ family response regulator
MSHVSVAIVGSQKSIASALLALSKDKEIQVQSCYNHVAELFSVVTEPVPDVVLVDFAMVTESHYALLLELHRSRPKTRIIFLCNSSSETKLIDAFRYGASGFLESKDNDAFLAKAIRAVSNGEAWVPRHFVTKIVERLTEKSS